MSEEKKIGGRAFGETLNAEKFIEEQIALIREQVGGGKVLLALSGGVDSSVVAALLLRSIGDQLYCVHVNHGLMRKGESEQVIKVFREELGANLTYVDATDRFLDKLAGVSEPERKRKIIGEEFIHVFEEEAAKLQGIRFLGQGTIYPDIVESDKGVKAHHNVGGLPEKLGFELVEPVKYLFKDEVRQVGEALGLPHSMVWRQPFPGPGLGVRCIGAVTKEKLDLLREADAIWREELENNHVPADQYFAVLTDMRSVGVMGDFRTYDYTIALRAVVTSDFMTAEYAPVPHTVLAEASRRITNEVKGVNRVVYDITGKPPATIEWE